MTAITAAAADGAITPARPSGGDGVSGAGRRETRSNLDARPRRRFARAPPRRAPRSVQLAAQLLQDRCGLMAGSNIAGADDILLERRRGGPQIAELAV